MTNNAVPFALDALDRAEEFFEAFRQLTTPAGRPISWPRYFLFCHAVELALKAFPASRGVPPRQLREDFGHRIDPLMRDALSKGLAIGPLAASELMQLDEAHTKHWPRYPRHESKPVFVIDYFESYALELLRAVSAAVRGNGPIAMAVPNRE